MVCNSCGRERQNEKANFCEYCGISFHEGDGHEIKPTYDYSNLNGAEPKSVPNSPPMPESVELNQKEQPISFLNWLGTLLIPFIPLVGGLVNIVMLIIWSTGGNDVSESKKNWARARLVCSIITLVIVILFIVMLVNTPEFKEVLELEMESYNDILKEYR